MSRRHLLPLLLLALAAAPNVSAQHQWRDANGRMVYSDMPPPPSVAPGSVLRAPARPAPAGSPGGSGTAASEASASASAAPQAAPSKAAATPTSADRELEFQKRRLEKVEADRKTAEAGARAERKATACADSRSEVRSLESGMRMSRVNERGERETLDEAQRASRLEAARSGAREACQG